MWQKVPSFVRRKQTRGGYGVYARDSRRKPGPGVRGMSGSFLSISSPLVALFPSGDDDARESLFYGKRTRLARRPYKLGGISARRVRVRLLLLFVCYYYIVLLKNTVVVEREKNAPGGYVNGPSGVGTRLERVFRG